MAQKTRLTYEYVNDSRQLYRETRMVLRRKLPLAQQGRAPVSLYGTEEAAEPAFLTLREGGGKGRQSSGGHRENHVPGLAGAAPRRARPGRAAAADRRR